MTRHERSTRWRHRRRSAAAAAACILAAAAGCRDAAPLRIGIIVGEKAVTGVLAIEEDVNDAGGIGGRRLQLVLLPESATGAAPALRGAEQMAGDPTILAVVGHGNSAATLAASQVYNATGLPHVAPTSTATLLSTAGPYSFRLVPADRRQARFMASEAQRLAGARTAAIVYDNDDYGRGLARDLVLELKARGVPVVASVPYLAAGATATMSLMPRRVAEQAPEAVFWLGRQTQLAEFLAAIQQELPGVLVMAGDGADTPQVYADPAAYAGLHFVRFLDPASTAPCMVALRARMPHPLAGRADNVLTHDAVLVVVESLRAGARTREGVRRHLAAIGGTAPPVRGCAGPIAFDSRGDIERPYLLARADSQGIHTVAGDRR